MPKQGVQTPPAPHGSVGPNQEKSAADVYRQQCNEVCVCYMRSVWGGQHPCKRGSGILGGIFWGKGERGVHNYNSTLSKLRPSIQNSYASMVWVELGAPLLLQMNPDVTAFPKRIFFNWTKFSYTTRKPFSFWWFQQMVLMKIFEKNNVYIKSKERTPLNNEN